MTVIIKNNSKFISTSEAAQLSSYSLKAVRDWCIKNKRFGWAYKHSNKWYLHKERYLESLLKSS